jgi:hypothetical protein
MGDSVNIQLAKNYCPHCGRSNKTVAGHGAGLLQTVGRWLTLPFVGLTIVVRELWDLRFYLGLAVIAVLAVGTIVWSGMYGHRQNATAAREKQESVQRTMQQLDQVSPAWSVLYTQMRALDYETGEIEHLKAFVTVHHAELQQHKLPTPLAVRFYDLFSWLKYKQECMSILSPYLQLSPPVESP